MIPVPARRVFRLGLVTALSLAAAYALGFALPYLAPMFAIFLTLAPKPPMKLKGLVVTLLLVLVSTGLGLLLTPILEHYSAIGLALVLLGIYVANHISMNLRKAVVGTLLTVGLTLITAVGSTSSLVAKFVIQELCLSIVIVVICQYVVYPFFPEKEASRATPKTVKQLPSAWAAWRTTLIVFPAYLLGLFNPGAYLPIIMKSVALSQQVSGLDVRRAGRELLGSTFLGGILSVIFWWILSLSPTLWLFFWLTLLFALFFGAKIYRVWSSRYPASFWQNAIITLLIMIGPAVADSQNGKDVYQALVVRMGLFLMVTIYALAAFRLLEWWKERQQIKDINQPNPAPSAT